MGPIVFRRRHEHDPPRVGGSPETNFDERDNDEVGSTSAPRQMATPASSQATNQTGGGDRSYTTYAAKVGGIIGSLGPDRSEVGRRHRDLGLMVAGQW